MADERRDKGRESDDRRKIKRFSDSKIFNDYIHILKWVRILFVIILLFATYRIVEGLFLGAADTAQAIFVSSFLYIFAAVLFNYSQALNYYLNNESVENLERTIDKQLFFWKFSGIFVIIGCGVNIILNL